MITVKQLQHIGEFRLHLTFSDGTSGEADLSSLLQRPPFTPLREPKMFAEAFVDHDGGTVAWPVGLDVAPDTLYALAHGFAKPQSYDETQNNEREVGLRELRKMSSRTQVELASAMKVTQPELSRLEGRREDFKVSTIRKYLAALGWDMEIVAVQGSKRITLRGF